MEPQCPERAFDPDSADFYRPEQEQALLSIPATPKKRKNVPQETIDTAVNECVEKKIAVSVLAERYEVHPSTIRAWVKRAGKTLPSKQATTPRKADDYGSILNFFSPTKKLSAPPPEARDNAMDMSDYLSVKVEEHEIEIDKEIKTTSDNKGRRRREDGYMVTKNVVESGSETDDETKDVAPPPLAKETVDKKETSEVCSTAECLKKLRQEFKMCAKRKLVAGKKRNREHKTTMLFMESGRRQSPWYTWQVTAGEDNSGSYDIQKKAKRGDKTEEATFQMRSFKRRKRPARCSWSARCYLCGRNEVQPGRLNIKRKSVYLSDTKDEGGPTKTNRLGRMSAMVWKSETVTAHYFCLFYAADPHMVQAIQGNNIDTELEGFPIKAVLDQVKKSQKDKCVFCHGFGAASQCANVKCINFGWYHFPCGLENGTVQDKEKTWCGRCSGGPTNCLVPRGRRQSVERKGRGRGRQKKHILPGPALLQLSQSQSSQDLFSNFSREPWTSSAATSSRLFGVTDLSRDGDAEGCLSRLLHPISAQQIIAEIDRRKEERSKVLENPIRSVNIAQVQQIPKEEFMGEDEQAVKVESKQPLERYSIFDSLPGDQDINDPDPSSPTNVLERVVLDIVNYEENISILSPSVEQPSRPESRSLLEEDLETEPFDFDPENPEEEHSNPKLSMGADNDSIIIIEDEVERNLPQKRGESASQNQMEQMGRQLELTDGLLKAKRAELEQLEIKHNEEVNFFEKKLQMKDCEIALLKERNCAEMTKKEEDWKAEKESEEAKWKEEVEAQNSEISKLRSELEKAKKETGVAIGRLSQIYQISSPQGVKREGEYVERWSDQDVGSCAGVKREVEEEESDGGAAEKRPRRSLWDF